MRNFWQKDKQQHFIVCFFITMSTFPLLGYYSMFFALVVGTLKEVADEMEHGVFDMRDMAADCVGILSGGLVCGAIQALSFLVQKPY